MWENSRNNTTYCKNAADMLDGMLIPTMKPLGE